MNNNGNNMSNIIKFIVIIGFVLSLTLSLLLNSYSFLSMLTSDNSVDNLHFQIFQLKIAFYHSCIFFSFCFIFTNNKTNRIMLTNCENAISNNKTKLFAISFLILFIELALIRWIPAYLKLMSYFTNFILLACFLGIGIGCMCAGRRIRLFKYFPMFLAFIVIIIAIIYPLNYAGLLSYQTGNYSESIIYFGGTQHAINSLLQNTIVFMIVIFVFLIIAFLFSGPGQIMGELFNDIDNPVHAYSINIVASIFGIIAFSALSMLCLPAWLWFVVISIITLTLSCRSNILFIIQTAIFVILATSLAFMMNISNNSKIIWSPYYRITYTKPLININDIGHQLMVNYHNDTNPAYNLANLIARDSHSKIFEDVLVIGSGSGNDVAHQLLYGAKRIDAVDIEPTVIKIGKEDHPNKPYENANVSIINDDGRSFLKSTEKKYDLIVYGAVDSITLMSGFSSVRLESYLFTTDAFEDVKKRLKPGGIFVINNYLRQNWLSVRIYRMLETVFDQEPVLLMIPNKRRISDLDGPSDAISLYMAGDISHIKRAFQNNDNQYQMITETPWKNSSNGFAHNGFHAQSDESDIDVFSYNDVEVIGGHEKLLPNDNWPFVYLRRQSLPTHNLWGLFLIAILSCGLILTVAGKESVSKISFHFFFLGAAFMLLETESITKLALIYGSTWFVNSVVFIAVLAMIFMANIYIIKRPIGSVYPAFFCLIASLIVNYLIGVDFYLGKGWFWENIISNIVIFCPIAFAALIFARSFSKSTRPAFDLSSNLLGIILGGLAEYASLKFGYNALLILAAILYFCAMFFMPRRRIS